MLHQFTKAYSISTVYLSDMFWYLLCFYSDHKDCFLMRMCKTTRKDDESIKPKAGKSRQKECLTKKLAMKTKVTTIQMHPKI